MNEPDEPTASDAVQASDAVAPDEATPRPEAAPDGPVASDAAARGAPSGDDDSPISDAALEHAAADVASFWRLVQKRAPREVNRRVRQVMESIYRVVNSAEATRHDRLHLARELEAIAAELRGRKPFVPQFYREGRLAIVWAWDPIKIRGAVDHVRVQQQFERYLARADKAYERLDYFLARAGLDVAPKAEKKPWEQAYAAFEEYRELIWGRVRPDIT